MAKLHFLTLSAELNVSTQTQTVETGVTVKGKVVFLHKPGSGAAGFIEEFIVSRPTTTTSSSFRKSSTRKLRHFTFTRSIRSPVSSLKIKQII